MQLLTLEAESLSIKWDPPHGGAQRYIVELAQADDGAPPPRPGPCYFRPLTSLLATRTASRAAPDLTRIAQACDHTLLPSAPAVSAPIVHRPP